MARNTVNQSPMTAATSLLCTSTEKINTLFVVPNTIITDRYTTNWDRYVGFISATSTATLLSIQGPGVISYLEFAAQVYAQGPAAQVQVFIDGEMVKDVSLSFSNDLICVIGGRIGDYTSGTGVMPIQDPVPFNNELLLTYKSNYSPQVYLAANWRLTGA